MAEILLFGRGRSPFATGASRFRDSIGGTTLRTGPRVYVEVVPGIWPVPVLAMVDTGAPWCIFEPQIGEEIRDSVEVLEENACIHSRLGRFWGTLCSGRLTLPAEEGEPLAVDALMFLSPDWPGGNFIGYEGFLDRIRFAVDPHRNRFYFSAL